MKFLNKDKLKQEKRRFKKLRKISASRKNHHKDAPMFFSRLISSFTKHGLKKKSYRNLIVALNFFRETNKLTSYSNLHILSLFLTKLNFGFRLRKFHLSKRKTVLIPQPLPPVDRIQNIILHLKRALKKRPEKTFKLRLSNEIADLLKNKSYIQKLDKNLLLSVKQNKSNYRFLKKMRK